MLKISKMTNYQDLLPGLARYTSPNYLDEYDGQQVDPQILEEDVPLLEGE